MSLGSNQRDFTKCIGKLITWAYEQGYALTFGDAYRDARVHGKHGEKQSYSAARSNHKVRLAVDLNLFIFDQNTQRWVYCTATETYKPLGEYWKSLDSRAQWGGELDRNDGNHFSFLYEGAW